MRTFGQVKIHRSAACGRHMHASWRAGNCHGRYLYYPSTQAARSLASDVTTARAGRGLQQQDETALTCTCTLPLFLEKALGSMASHHATCVPARVGLGRFERTGIGP